MEKFAATDYQVDGVYQEQDASGKEIIVPRFELLFVDKIE